MIAALWCDITSGVSNKALIVTRAYARKKKHSHSYNQNPFTHLWLCAIFWHSANVWGVFFCATDKVNSFHQWCLCPNPRSQDPCRRSQPHSDSNIHTRKRKDQLKYWTGYRSSCFTSIFWSRSCVSLDSVLERRTVFLLSCRKRTF